MQQSWIASDTFGSSEGESEMLYKLCTGCGVRVDLKYTECYACHIYGPRSYSQVRQANAMVAQKTEVMMRFIPQTCKDCGGAIPEDSTRLHVCRNNSARKTKTTQLRASRRAGKVRVVKTSTQARFEKNSEIYAGLRTPSRVRPDAGF